ncbi:MAG: hypothetical protein ACTSPY_09900 [Candidatus Helarchaeota archaeon]
MSTKKEITPKWILFGIFLGLVVGFIIGVLSEPTLSYTFNVLPIVLCAGPIVFVLAILYVYLTELKNKEEK